MKSELLGVGNSQARTAMREKYRKGIKKARAP